MNQSIEIRNGYRIAHETFATDTALVQLYTTETLLHHWPVLGRDRVVAHLRMVGPVSLPTILEFLRSNSHVPNVCIQCPMGVVDSMAIGAAWANIIGGDVRPVMRMGTYNRRLYADMLDLAGLSRPVDKLAAVVVPVHPRNVDGLHGLICSMRQQRHENWQLIAVTEGENLAAEKVVSVFGDSRVRLIKGGPQVGDYGNCYRQIGFDALDPATEYVNTNNDDSYLTPGFLEQLIFAMEELGTVAAQCDSVHSYGGYQTNIKNADFGNGLEAWLVRANVVKAVPFSDTTIEGEGEWLKGIIRFCDKKVAYVQRPLVVHN